MKRYNATGFQTDDESASAWCQLRQLVVSTVTTSCPRRRDMCNHRPWNGFGRLVVQTTGYGDGAEQVSDIALHMYFYSWRANYLRCQFYNK